MRATKGLATRCALLLMPFVCLTAGANSRLVEAAKAQSSEAVRALLKTRTDVNASQADGVTALHWAAYWDDLETVDLLLKAGAKVNAADEHGVTPLGLACNAGVATIEKLLAAGANPNIVTTTGKSPLMTCARAGNAAAVKALVTHGANVNAKETLRDQTALMWAVAERHPEVVRILIESGADVHARTRVTYEYIVRVEDRARFVCASAKSGPSSNQALGPNEVCARAELAEKGGGTALSFAARAGDLESTRLLVAAGAKLDEAAADGNSALVLAAYSGQGEVAEFLLKKGANPNTAGAGYAPLHAAVLRGDLKLVKALLGHGANPNIQLTKGTPVNRDSQAFVLPESLIGASPLYLAAKYVEIDIMRTLMEAGANPSLKLKNGNTLLMGATGMAWRVGFTRRGTATPAGLAPPADDDLTLQAVQLVLERGVDVKAVNNGGDTALHGAASGGYAPVIQLLVEKGANLNAKNKRGQTPLNLAMADPELGKGRHELKSAELMLRKLGATEEAKLTVSAEAPEPPKRAPNP
jgi:uncharacterized protein